MKDITESTDNIAALNERIGAVIKGKDRAVRLAVATLLARGHLLIEDVPGVGKTTLAFTLAKAIDCSFQRIQFTSDLLPSDIIGVSIYNPDKREFEFKHGPIFANIVLADEINRTTPKTQSALLEAMNERQVSIDRKTHILPEPFMVIATQNPVEYRGTFPLPESQLDRFALHLRLGYPEMKYEKLALSDQMDFNAIEGLKPVLKGSDIVNMQHAVDAVRVEDSVLDYLLNIVNETRINDRVRLGVSTRGAQFLLKISRAFAYCDGRDYVLPADIKNTAPHVLGHRIILKRQTHITEAAVLIEEIIDRIAVPV